MGGTDVDEVQEKVRLEERAVENAQTEPKAKRPRVRVEDDADTVGRDEPEMNSDPGSVSDSDSDSDVEFVLGPVGGSAKKPDAVASAVTVPIDQKPTLPAVKNEFNSDREDTGSPGPNTDTPKVEIDSVGDFNGNPITKIPLADFDDKPWRAPGANISDYFNYGFDELTWTAYCMKQDQLRAHLTPQRVYAMMGMPMMPMMPMMMPPMMMPGMPGFTQNPSQ